MAAVTIEQFPEERAHPAKIAITVCQKISGLVSNSAQTPVFVESARKVSVPSHIGQKQVLKVKVQVCLVTACQGQGSTCVFEPVLALVSVAKAGPKSGDAIGNCLGHIAVSRNAVRFRHDMHTQMHAPIGS